MESWCIVFLENHFLDKIKPKEGFQTLYFLRYARNRPFAGSGQMVRNKLRWDANNAVGLSKQKNSYQSSPTFLCFESSTASQRNLFRTMWLDPAKGPLTPFKTRYPTITIVWPYRELQFRAHQGHVVFEVDHWPRTFFESNRGLMSNQALLLPGWYGCAHPVRYWQESVLVLKFATCSYFFCSGSQFTLIKD